MAAELLVASLMVLLCVILHGFGLSLLAGSYRALLKKLPLTKGRQLNRFALIVLVVLGLFALHGIEIWLYAGLYRLLGAVDTLSDAVYFSTITYGAIGYSDVGMAPQWRLVAAIEGINGVLLIGWSTAFFVTTMARLQRR